MSAPGALALTAVVLTLASLVVAFVADWGHKGRRLSSIGWLLFAAACLSFIGAAWWAVLA